MTKPMQRLAAVIFVLWLLYSFASVGLRSFTGGSIYGAMLWNLFLAILPLGLAALAQRTLRRNKLCALGLAALWLLLFPNAPYLVTDFVHLSWSSYYQNGGYTQQIGKWILLFYISTGVLIGILGGMLSLHMLLRPLARKWGIGAAAFALAALSLLSGYAIYVGRFLRLNSWDVLHPVQLFTRLLQNINAFTVQFTLIAAGFCLFCYGVFYVVFALPRQNIVSLHLLKKQNGCDAL